MQPLDSLLVIFVDALHVREHLGHLIDRRLKGYVFLLEYVLRASLHLQLQLGC